MNVEFLHKLNTFKLKVVKDDNDTKGAVPSWKINDLVSVAVFSSVWRGFRSPRGKKENQKILLENIGVDRVENELRQAV